MKVALFIAHPGISESAYGGVSRMNRAMLEHVKDLPNVTVVDLSKDQDIPKHQKLMEESDRIVLQFPIFWFNMPSLAKKWLDDVLTHGWAYGHAYKLEGKGFMYGVTSGQPEQNYTPTGRVGKTMDEVLVSIKLIANHCKMKFLPGFLIGDAMNISDPQLQEMAKKYSTHIITPF